MTVLAFGFAAPWLLWGVVLAAVPVLIHLLYRRRYRETRWAAMQFLIAAAQKQSRSFRIDHWLLLILRTLIPLAAAIAVAGPMFSAPTQHTSAVRTQRLLIVDASLSLAAVDQQGSRFDRLRGQAESVLQLTQPGDLWQLIRMAGTAPTVLISEPARQTTPVSEELRNLTVTAERADLLAALRAGHSLLSKDADVEAREVHLFTDSQRTAWRPPQVAQQEELRDALQQLSKKARVVWHDITDPPVTNAAVTSLTTTTSVVFPQQPVRVTAKLRVYGAETPVKRNLRWLVDDRVSSAETIEFTPGEDLQREFTITPTAAGMLRIEARLEGDALADDDRRRVVIPVLASLPVLLVDGRPSPQPFENATDLLRLALRSQAGDAEIAHTGIDVTVITDGELLGTDLSRYAVVFLCDVPRLTDRDGEVLRQYVGRGGALVIGVGPGVKAENYNAVLYRDGRDLLPARLGDQVGDPEQRQQRFVFDPLEFQHPILQPFRGNPNTGFELTQTFAYLQTIPAPERSRVALRFDSGDAALIEAPYRDGRVMLSTTSFDRRWSAWPLWGHSFVPMMQETVRYFTMLKAAERTLTVGQPLTARLEGARSDDRVTIRRQGEDGESVTLRAQADGAGVTWDGPRRPGFYAVETGGSSRPQWFAVNVDPRESDLAPLSVAELREELLRGLEAELASTDVAATDEHWRPGQETAAAWGARWVLAALLIFLLAEPFLAWNRTAGLMVLIGLLSAGLAATIAGWPAALVVIALGAAVGVWQMRRQASAPLSF
ncbi:MAG TPA: BatA domain-containing protein [Planctomycetaceae bacterium]|nr:BatA domain-containing protein [Planctomycetaceae bacterium]